LIQPIYCQFHLQLWSNGRFKSTLHRVVTTRNVHRYSTPFFVHPSHDTMVRSSLPLLTAL